MQLWKTLVLPLACVLSIGIEACGDKSSAEKSPGGKSSGDKSSVKPSRGPEDPHVEKFRIGHGVGPDGEVTAEGRTFARGEKVHASFAIADAKPEAQARVVWVTKPGGAKMAEETKPLNGRDNVVIFTADTKNWETGTYAVETWVVQSGDNGVRRIGMADFSVANSKTK
jgi:hypothetical protein